MRSPILCLAALGGLVFLAADQAWGQGYGRPAMGPYGSPTVSPYLNLARGNFGVGTTGFNNPALNYYNLVRPHLNFYAGIASLQQQQLNLAGQTNAIEGDIAGATATGHRFGYFTHTAYFLNNRGQVGRGGGGGAARTALAAPRGGGRGR